MDFESIQTVCIHAGQKGRGLAQQSMKVPFYFSKARICLGCYTTCYRTDFNHSPNQFGNNGMRSPVLISPSSYNFD